MEHFMSMTEKPNRWKTCPRAEGVAPEKRWRGSTACFALRLAREGDWVEIVSLAGGKGCQDKLLSMGLRIGARVQVLRNNMEGKLLLGHQGARLYLGGGMAHRVQVAAIKGGEK